ncbi:CASP-like protein 4C1 [Camellia sinensis]|uniref:CASP-like protein 4C1 n=1 Tax=Camellia sinensis TaxID=4442 RepID=UPI001036084C|nr:CASP-like protein 4C1 [Camellia sinensis]
MNHRIFQNKDPQLSSRRTAFSYELFSSSSLSLSSSSSSSLQSISLTVTLLMRSPQDREALRNSETPSPRPGIQSHHHHHFHSTVSVQKLRRLNTLIFVFRLAAFCFSVAASVFMLVNPTSASNSPRWYNFDAFRFVLAANTIVAVYSLFEMGASVWEISSGVTLLPEILQVWFDFGHDQVFAYLLLSADSAGTALARTMKGTDTCTDNNAFCVQTDISIALGFAGFLFLGLSSILSGFRVVSFIINGSRLHL